MEGSSDDDDDYDGGDASGSMDNIPEVDESVSEDA